MEKKASLHFVQGINFELTYQCNYACSHCLQNQIRAEQKAIWINTELVKQALRDAKSLGLLKLGVNFTGGEIFHSNSNLPELLELSKELKLNIRVNTNGWWGNKNSFKLGNYRFLSLAEIISWLKERINMLVLSYDQRYSDNKSLLEPVLSIMQECENQQLPYQVNFTSNHPTDTILEFRQLLSERHITLNYLQPVFLELVDIGGSKNIDHAGYKNGGDLTCYAKGFYRPTYLHISPNGGVRSCLLATNASWMGNLNNESLSSIVNNFNASPVVNEFKNKSIKQLYDEFLKPNISDSFKRPQHLCSELILISHAIEKAQNN